MENKNHPGVYIPPPLLYIATFFLAILLQKFASFGGDFFYTATSRRIGFILTIIGFFFIFPAIRQFFRTKNTLITIKGATSLQTKGIYSISRNPMYLSLLLFYTGLSFVIGNFWHFILLPFLFIIVQEYVIKREEKYLGLRFGQFYLDYKQKVRRWL